MNTGRLVRADRASGGGCCCLAMVSRRVSLRTRAQYQIDLNPKVKIEIVVPEPLVPRVLHDLERALRTGTIGDGKDLRHEDRIRTGERGEDSL